MWSLSNAFTSAMKELEGIPRFRATAMADVQPTNQINGMADYPISCKVSHYRTRLLFQFSE